MSRPARIAIAFLLLTGARAAAVQQIDPTVPPPPPPPEEPAPPLQPSFDPYHAEMSIQVGTFYMKKGDYDAAIDRFEEAARYQPTLARPWKLMGEAYEKKRAFSMAAQSYKKYLEILPHAEDAAKIKKRIADLGEKVEQDPTKKGDR